MYEIRYAPFNDGIHRREVMKNSEQLGELDPHEYGGNPRMVFCSLQTVERLSEAKVTENVKCRKVVPRADVKSPIVKIRLNS